MSSWDLQCCPQWWIELSTQSKMKTHPASNYDDQGWHYRQFNHKVSASWSFHSCTTLAGPDKAAARQSFRGKILNARASWVVKIINFPLSSPNNSIWKIIPNNPAQKFFVDVATSKHKFYFTFPFNDKTTQFSKHYLSSLLLIDVQNTLRGFDFKNIVQILKTQRWKPEVCTSIYT